MDTNGASKMLFHRADSLLGSDLRKHHGGEYEIKVQQISCGTQMACHCCAGCCSWTEVAIDGFSWNRMELLRAVDNLPRLGSGTALGMESSAIALTSSPSGTALSAAPFPMQQPGVCLAPCPAVPRCRQATPGEREVNCIVGASSRLSPMSAWLGEVLGPSHAVSTIFSHTISVYLPL